MLEMDKPRVCIVSPARPSDNNGNWHTAARWQAFLAPAAHVEVQQRWLEGDADVLIALHARRSADSIARFRAAHARRPIVLVLTGTDVYRDIATDASARRSLSLASHLVCLQAKAPSQLDDAARAKVRVILQSAPTMRRLAPAADVVSFLAVGHLRPEKDPLTLMRAAQRLPASTRIRVTHVGAELDPSLGAAALQAMHACGQYRWVGALGHDEVRQAIAAAHALVHTSRIEGGANVLVEAICSGVPVLASDIDGNVGLLGDDYQGYFPVGNDTALAELMQRFASDASLACRLTEQCAALAPRFATEVEARAVKQLLLDCLHWPGC